MTINKYNAMNAENVKMYLKGEITADELHKKGLEVLETILTERNEESDQTAYHWNCTADVWLDTGTVMKNPQILQLKDLLKKLKSLKSMAIKIQQLIL